MVAARRRGARADPEVTALALASRRRQLLTKRKGRWTMEGMGQRIVRGLVLAAAALVLVSLAPGAARAQPCQHGASIFKTCESPKRSCSVDADCPDTPCADGVCTGSVGGAFVDNHTNCMISLQNADTCGDTTKITEGFDIEDFGGDNVRVPAVGNLPISGIFGNAVC